MRMPCECHANAMRSWGPFFRLPTSACSKLRAKASTRPMRPCRRQGPLLALMHLCQSLASENRVKQVDDVDDVDVSFQTFSNMSKLSQNHPKPRTVCRLLCRCLARISTTGSLSCPPVSSGIETMTLSMDTCSLASESPECYTVPYSAVIGHLLTSFNIF